MSHIITIGREFGSGGRELGARLAQELGFAYYDREIVSAMAEQTSLSEDYIRQVTEHRSYTFYPINIGQSFSFFGDHQNRMLQSVYGAQSEIVRDLAARSDCVIVGRCADYILREEKPFRIFVHASMESRIARCAARSEQAQSLPEKDLRKQIRDIDHARSRYYGDFTGQTWGSKENYDLCINTTDADIPTVVRFLTGLIRQLP